ncbi:hypothetical protein KDA_08000 [Dictyobacter alpinus]|uniref:Uncharacterized protein n=1 Tax=Dictyobacter alpinus TaxID=2014873 RepID=A0A402B1S8_9CHLR|nr:hypothetical protein [Dictyobacter alpinus]GCE25316.1 hypothetical protein KDA_08000 [Dictyobacter alpinus]
MVLVRNYKTTGSIAYFGTKNNIFLCHFIYFLRLFVFPSDATFIGMVEQTMESCQLILG